MSPDKLDRVESEAIMLTVADKEVESKRPGAGDIPKHHVLVHMLAEL